ncbi:MAG TPA: homocysteine S-methyltransferase family protein, partial [Candidatus Aminicenantes bacterium]|nr:homocysteine S-methyltransferase family protein [Candidatus Aminicenantes bacterium]
MKLGRQDRLMEVLPPLDWSRVGSETWLDACQALHRRGTARTLKQLLARKSRRQAWEEWFRSIRQPSWWQGDDQPHPPAGSQPGSRLQEKLAAGEFVVTAEIAPPLAGNAGEVVKNLDLLRNYIDAANFTDNPSATARMSSLACAATAVKHGVEPVLQIAARDRTRTGLQAEIMGAAALGIRNVLCLTGDHPRLGPVPPGRMDIWDLDSIQMVWLLRRMRDEGILLDGRKLRTPPPLFIGAAASPSAADETIQALRELKKCHAGAQFFQSNVIFDLEAVERYLEALDKVGLLGQAHFLAGVTPVRSARAARIMNEVPGVRIPEAIVKRLESSRDPREEGVQIALETIERLRRFPGIHGIHIMAVGWELIVPRLVSESGLKGAGATGEGGDLPPVVGEEETWQLRPQPFTNRRYLDALAERVLVFDGACGTSIQKMKLSDADFGGEKRAGCNDWLVIQKPEAIRAVHESFLEAGCDVIETATFRTNRITMAEYDLADRVDDINRAAARLARECADARQLPDKPRFVAGSIGPSGQLPSSSDPELSAVPFAELVDVFRQQALGLIDGGCDLIVVETMQDVLEVKAAVIGVQRAFSEAGQRLPLQVQVTLDPSGRTLLGADIGTALATLEHMAVDVIGINCSTGPEHMHASLS